MRVEGGKIVRVEVCPDHVHMLVEIPPKPSVSSFMGYWKGKSSTMLYAVRGAEIQVSEPRVLVSWIRRAKMQVA